MEVLISEFHSFVEDRCQVECLTISVNLISVNYQIISRVSTNIVKPTKSLKKISKNFFAFDRNLPSWSTVLNYTE